MEQTFTYTVESIAKELNKWHISNYEPGYQELSMQQRDSADNFTESDFEQALRLVSRPVKQTSS